MDNLSFRLKIFLFILIAIMTIGTVGFMITEHLSLFDSIYFSIVTVTTVGYGDITPMTHAGKILSIFLIITGVGTFLGVVANSTEILMNRQEAKTRREKLNMVVGVFFSEAGSKLLIYFTESDLEIDLISNDLLVSHSWSEKEFAFARERLKQHNYSVDISKIDLKNLKNELNEKGNVILRLLENPSLLEHESFTALIKALLHLRDELEYRDDFSKLPETDLLHLTGDIKRAYVLLSQHWLDHAEYLKEHYPYLFSLAARINPFNKDRTPIVYEQHQ